MSDTSHPQHPSDWRRIAPFSLTIFFSITAYAIVRYNVFKGVDIEFIPLYILNKILALSSVVFIGISYLLGPVARFADHAFETKLSLRRPLGLLGFACAGIHSALSLVLLSPYYYPSLFMGGRFTFFASLHILSGILAGALFTIVAISSIPNVMQTTDSSRWHSVQRIGYIAYMFVLMHVYTVGVNSWKDVSIWPGAMAPISLIAFNIIMVVLLVKMASVLFWRPKNTA